MFPYENNGDGRKRKVRCSFCGKSQKMRSSNSDLKSFSIILHIRDFQILI